MGTAQGDCVLFSIAAPYKTAFARPLTSQLPNHPSETNKTSRTLKQGLTHKRGFLWTTIHGHISVVRKAKTYVHKFCADIGCRLEDLPSAIIDGDRCQGRVKMLSQESVLLACLDDDDDVASLRRKFY